MKFRPLPTTAQKKLVRRLREKKISCLENQEVEGWEVDILLPAYHLAVEINGFYHLSAAQQRKDREKTAQLTAAGYHVVRFVNTEIHEQCEDCVKIIEALIRKHKTRVRKAEKADPGSDAWRRDLKKIWEILDKER